MKKVVKVFIIIVIGLFLLVVGMLSNDKHYEKNMIKNITKETKIKDIKYINKYDNYYIVMDKESLYLINDKYKIISELNKKLLYDNKKKYDIIYKDNIFMYFNDYIEDDKLIYEYYDIYTYKLLDKIVLGGN